MDPTSNPSGGSSNLEAEDYFGKAPEVLNYPEFTKRNLNHLLNHERPLPRGVYGLIRGRDIFDRVESYRIFLEDLRE